MSTEGKVALVTGSGTGIGRAISLELAGLGLSVAVNGRRDEGALEETISMIETRGGRAVAVLADVTIPAEVELMKRKVKEEFGDIQVLVNNVGDFLMKPLLEVTPAQWERTIASNLHSAFYTCQAVVGGMIENGWGRIVNIGLAGSDLPGASPEIASYAVAKTGLWVLTKCLSREVAGNGITVNMVAPGVIETSTDEPSNRLAHSVPAGRAGRVEEVARAVAFFVDEGSSYITGACLNVSGGWQSVR